MTRYMMSIKDAVKLIFEAADLSIDNEIFILKMPIVKIEELAEVMIEKYSDCDLNIKNIGIGDGEKMHEKLISDNELRHVYENDDLCVICSTDTLDYYKSKGFTKLESMERNVLSKVEIHKLLEELYE